MFQDVALVLSIRSATCCILTMARHATIVLVSGDDRMALGVLVDTDVVPPSPKILTSKSVSEKLWKLTSIRLNSPDRVLSGDRTGAGSMTCLTHPESHI